MTEPDVHPQPPDDPRAYPVEWHRPDPQRKLFRAWGIGALVLVAGAAVLAQAVTAGPEMSSAVRFLLVLLAVGLSAAGPLYAVITAIRCLADETCLVLRSDGVQYLSAERSFFVRWRDVVAAAYDEQEDALRIETETTELLIRHPHFVGVKSRELAERLNDVRRRALLGLIRPADVWGWEENRTPNRH